MKTYTIAVIAAALALASCSGKKTDPTITDAPELPIVTVDVARARDVVQGRDYTATVEAENINNISPQQPNRIKTISVREGDAVTRGQLLVTMDDASAEQLRINLEQIEREYNRAVRRKAIGAGTQQAVDQLRAQLDAARRQYTNILENTRLVSPITGVVTARNYDPGDMTGSMPVLTVGQLTPQVKVVINVSESDLAKVHNGMGVDITFDAYPGETFTGRVSRIHPTVDPASRTFCVEVQVPNPAARIRPGMFGRVNLSFGTKNNVVVPDRAVVKQTGSGNRYVYVYSNGKVYFRRITTGQRLDNAYELLDGISDGDTVVITGQTRLADGVEVELRQ